MDSNPRRSSPRKGTTDLGSVQPNDPRSAYQDGSEEEDNQVFARQVADDRQQYWDYAYPEDADDENPPYRGWITLKKHAEGEQPRAEPKPAPDNKPKPKKGHSLQPKPLKKPETTIPKSTPPAN